VDDGMDGEHISGDGGVIVTGVTRVIIA
jgi:hypothetical protein